MTSYLGVAQQEVLALLVDDGRERSASQLVPQRRRPVARKALRLLANRGLVSERKGWAGWMYTVTPEGHDILKWYR